MRDEYPYLIQGHMYQYDLHWIVENIKNIWIEIDSSVELHTIKYADPIQWDITTQYQANTVVVDPKTGTAYISTKPVPSGILLTDTNYWTVVFNFQKVYTDIMKNISAHYVDGKTSTFDLKTNELVWFEDDLYYALHDIDIGDALVPDANIKKTTVEDMLKISFKENMLNFIGGNRTTTLDNDILNVSGDWTVQAGDITETADNKTVNILSTFDATLKTAKLNMKSSSFPVVFPDKTIDLYHLDAVASVLKYGAIGDGITDDTVAIQNALNAEQSLYFPAGTYLISSTLTIPSNRCIMGAGLNTIIKANLNSFNMLSSEKFDSLTGKDVHDSAVGNWEISDIVFDGNYWDFRNNSPTGRAGGNGICLYGDNWIFENVVISNCPENGLWLENNTYNNPAYNLLKSGEFSLINVTCKYNGKHGVYATRVFDWAAFNLVCASNNRLNADYDNLHMARSNAKIVASHFYSNYGEIKPRASVYIEKEAHRTTFTGCHFEGAKTPLICHQNYALFTDCNFYASFGSYAAEFDGERIMVNNCIFGGQATDTTPESKPTWKCAVKLGATIKNCVFNAIMENTPFCDDVSGIQYGNDFNIRGYNASNLMNNTAMQVNFSKGSYYILGDFASQSCYRYIKSDTFITDIGSPIMNQFNILNMTADTTATATQIIIDTHSAGALIINSTRGTSYMILNRTSSNIPVKNSSVNGIANYSLKANSGYLGFSYDNGALALSPFTLT